MQDGSTVMKKADGTILLINTNNDKVILDNDGNVKYKDSFRFKLHYNMAHLINNGHNNEIKQGDSFENNPLSQNARNVNT